MKLLENLRDRPRTKESSSLSAGIDKKFLVSFEWPPGRVSNTKDIPRMHDFSLRFPTSPVRSLRPSQIFSVS